MKVKELKLLIREENRELLEEIAANMSNSSLTSALNFVLETQGVTVLEQLKAMKSSRNSSVGIPQSPHVFNSGLQTSMPELDSDTVASAFD